MSKLPDCMMPDGGEPCAGYRQMETCYEESRSREKGERILRLRAEKDRAALIAAVDYQSAQMFGAMERHRCMHRGRKTDLYRALQQAYTELRAALDATGGEHDAG